MSSVSVLYCLRLVITPERLSSVTTLHGQFCDLFLSSMRGKLGSSVFIKSVFAESLCVLFTVTDRFFVQVFYFVNVNRVVKKLRVCGYHP